MSAHTLARMVDWWVTALLTLLGAATGYLGHVAQAKVATRDNQDTLAEAKRAKALEHMRWAMDLMVSDEVERRSLGASQLTALTTTPHLTDDDLRLIRAATAVALDPLLKQWDTGQAAAQGGEELP